VAAAGVVGVGDDPPTPKIPSDSKPVPPPPPLPNAAAMDEFRALIVEARAREDAPAEAGEEKGTGENPPEPPQGGSCGLGRIFMYVLVHCTLRLPKTPISSQYSPEGRVYAVLLGEAAPARAQGCQGGSVR